MLPLPRLKTSQRASPNPRAKRKRKWRSQEASQTSSLSVSSALLPTFSFASRLLIISLATVLPRLPEPFRKRPKAAEPEKEPDVPAKKARSVSEDSAPPLSLPPIVSLPAPTHAPIISPAFPSPEPPTAPSPAAGSEVDAPGSPASPTPKPRKVASKAATSSVSKAVKSLSAKRPLAPGTPRAKKSRSSKLLAAQDLPYAAKKIRPPPALVKTRKAAKAKKASSSRPRIDDSPEVSDAPANDPAPSFPEGATQFYAQDGRRLIPRVVGKKTIYARGTFFVLFISFLSFF
jgi:hypothetical protein